ncbi:MAG: IPTL-CTERM sorting domain-containing protein [Xanthomonadales bacterium]|nr:IPTL-CTERM sorting domain-containing protein [Xanthomonadales bacterium]
MLRTITKTILLIGTVIPAIAFAQPTVLVENVMVPIGTPSVAVEVSLTTTAGQTASQWQVLYDDTNLTPDISMTCPTPAVMACSNPMPGVIQFVSGFFPAGGLPNFTGDIIFDLTAAPVGVYPLNLANELHSDGGGNLPPVGSMGGSIDIQDVPVPNYNSTPMPGGTLDFGTPVAGTGNVDVALNIENNGIPMGGVMNVTCSITNNPGGVYSLVSPADGMHALDIGQNADQVVRCDTTNPIDATGGVLSCDHDAPNPPDPATYTLDCFVTGEPMYASNPAPGDPILLGSHPQNQPNPTQTLLINNDGGENGSLLAGDCSLQFGNTPISLVGGPVVAYSVLQGAPPAGIDVTCDTSQGINPYADTLICTHNDPNFPGGGEGTVDATYPVTCEITEPLPAQYASTPARDPGNDPGTIEIDITPVEPVLVGATPPTANLNISNAAPAGNDFLELTGCAITAGTGEITAAPPSLTTNLDPGQSTNVVFSCATGTAGLFSATYECPYDESPTDPPPIEGVTTGTAIYHVQCEVREPNSAVVESPPSGTPQTAELMPGESTTFSFTFTETIDEGLAASLDDCVLANNAEFAITAGGPPYPIPIPSGESVQVDVTFTDPGAGDTFNDTLSCSFTDAPPPPAEGAKTFVSWPLEVTVVGRNARFRVTKDFDDDNPAGVDVFLECNTGLPLQQSATIHDPDANADLGPGDFTFVDFVVVDFIPGTMECDIEETVPVGYEASYFADVGEDGVAANIFDDEFGCHYEGIESADFICEITNTLQPVDITVNKEWIDDNPEFQLPTWVDVTLFCNVPINNNFEAAEGGLYSSSQFVQPGFPGLWSVFPDWDGSTFCFAVEEDEAGVLQDESDCESIPLAPGQDGECTMVNTRLYAGIPTLSQYGLILMALLMLGVGLVAFRRYG